MTESLSQNLGIVATIDQNILRLRLPDIPPGVQWYVLSQPGIPKPADDAWLRATSCLPRFGPNILQYWTTDHVAPALEDPLSDETGFSNLLEALDRALLRPSDKEHQSAVNAVCSLFNRRFPNGYIDLLVINRAVVTYEAFTRVFVSLTKFGEHLVQQLMSYPSSSTPLLGLYTYNPLHATALADWTTLPQLHGLRIERPLHTYVFWFGEAINAPWCFSGAKVLLRDWATPRPSRPLLTLPSQQARTLFAWSVWRVAELLAIVSDISLYDYDDEHDHADLLRLFRLQITLGHLVDSMAIFLTTPEPQSHFLLVSLLQLLAELGNETSI